MEKNMDEKTYAEFIRKCRFGIYKRSYHIDGHEVDHCMIVIRDVETRLIMKFTSLGDYAVYTRNDDMPFSINDTSSMYSVASFLNYVFIDSWEKYKIREIGQITTRHARDFLNDYANCRTKSGGYPSHETACNKRKSISKFLIALIRSGKLNVCEDEIVSFRFVKRHGDGAGGRFVPRYLIPIRYHDEPTGGYKLLYRDMPIAMAERLVSMAEVYDPEIAFALVLQLYAGLRSGEVCNIRQNTSVFGPCFRITYADKDRQVCMAVEIDLLHEYPLRTDGKSTGRIKKERTQGVFSLFVPQVEDSYRRHLELIKGKPVEQTKPMFICKRLDKRIGVYKAMTISGYRDRVQRLYFDHVLPSCRDDADPAMRRYYAEMQGHTWGPHACRHWYTVAMILNGVDNVAELMNFRGDKSPRSAITYLERKGELNRRFAKAANKLGGMIRK